MVGKPVGGIADVVELELQDLMRPRGGRYLDWGRRWLALRILGQGGAVRYMGVFEAGREQGRREVMEVLRQTLNRGKGENP